MDAHKSAENSESRLLLHTGLNHKEQTITVYFVSLPKCQKLNILLLVVLVQVAWGGNIRITDQLSAMNMDISARLTIDNSVLVITSDFAI